MGSSAINTLGVVNGLEVGDGKERLQWRCGQMMNGMEMHVSVSFLGTNPSSTRDILMTLATKS